MSEGRDPQGHLGDWGVRRDRGGGAEGEHAFNNDCLKPKHNNPCCSTIPDLPSPACAGGHDGDRHHGPPPRQQGGAGEDWQVRLHHGQVCYVS